MVEINGTTIRYGIAIAILLIAIGVGVGRGVEKYETRNTEERRVQYYQYCGNELKYICDCE